MKSNIQSIIMQTYKIGVIAICFIVLSKGVAGQTDDRMNQMVMKNITSIWPDTVSNTAGLPSYALACFYSDTNIPIANRLINRFYTEFPVPDATGISFDSYFWLHLVWRIYCDSTMNSRLTTEARDNIENMMWRFVNQRSEVEDARGSVWRIHDSENHDAMQKGSYLLCVEALKNAGAPYGPYRTLADGNTIQEHADAWSDYFQKYFVTRAKEGINVEIASPIYSKYTLGVYYNILDFAESSLLREIAKNFLDLYWADVVNDWTLSGVRGGAETRCYKDNYLWKGAQLASLTWAYGWHETAGTSRTYELIPTVSSYRVPEILTAIATDKNRPNYLYTSRRFGLDGGTGAGSGTYTIGFENGHSNLIRETYVTPDYTMGTLTFDMKKDYCSLLDQNRVMGVYFSSEINDRIVVYGEGASNEKSYADITGVCRKNCMLIQRDANASNSGENTLIFISQSIWDMHVDSAGWFFSKTGKAFIAINPGKSGYTAETTNAYGHIMQLNNEWLPAIIQLGQASNYDNFEAFQEDVLDNLYTTQGDVNDNPFTRNRDTVNYTSNAGDTFTIYARTTTTPQVNGETVDLNPAKIYDSPYLSMVHGEDTATVSYPGYPDLLIPFTLQDPTVGITSSENFFKDVSVYPNPTNGMVNINLGDLKNVTVKAYSIEGRQVYNKENIFSSTHQMEIKGNTGLYIINVSSQDKSLVFKILKE